MEHVEYVYMTGMDEEELDEYLRSGRNGVLALADDGDAYATPLSYHYDGDRFLLRVSHHDGGTKMRYLETTETATFVRYEATAEEDWSVHVRGPLSVWDRDVDDATINEWFEPFHLFSESVEDLEITLYELEMQSVVGRRTVD